MEILKPEKIGDMPIKNRLIMAPLTRSRADNPEAVPTELHVEYYKQRASAGLIISEGTVVSKQGVGYVNVPGIYSEKQVEAWQKVTDAVHENGGKIFMQIWHVGRISHPDLQDGILPVAPSSINPNISIRTPKGKEESVTPKALTVEEIQGIVEDFKNAGKNAMAAGFDGVEIHASNGYLFHQFFTNCSNQRTDQYGGNDENKSRFLFEVMDALKKVMPENRIGVRLNPMLEGMSGITLDAQTSKTFDYIVNRLNDYGLAYLHVSKPWAPSTSEFALDDVISHYRKIYNGFLIANNNYDKESAEHDIASEKADAIAFGRFFIANPDLPFRFENNSELAVPDIATFYSPGPKGYIDYPKYDII